ncbi:hypothetical protein LTR36_002259 [Oleoguttula mirabilis]|uniref:Uncharacterized protein n=1 Tax=Oleoguttula mirabilis TaxID=1507867 RepID=A0AAV9JLC1_9PEZI|nr:hypothetical protein LTR36_002259 [Oleoguttula mirabilis]
MGAVLSVITAVAVFALEIVKLSYFFLIIVPLSGFGIGALRRDDLSSSVSPYMPTIAVKCDGTDYQDQLQGQKIDIQQWNRQTGEAWACWREHEGSCGMMRGLWLYCWDWSESGVPDDVPKLGFDGMDTYTPNGTLFIKTPNGDGPVNATWIAPIAGDCKYWDEGWKWPEHKEEWEHTNVTVVSDLYLGNEWMPPKKKIPNLGPEPGSVVARRNVGRSDLSMDEHFSKLPRRGTGAALEAFAADGAALLHRSLQQRSDPAVSRESGDGTHQLLSRAFASIFEAHASEPQMRSFWKRLVGQMTGDSADVPADTVLDHLTDALVSRSHDHDKRRMETFAISGVFQAITDRAQRGESMGEAEFRAVARVWERVFNEDNGARR